MMCGSGAVVARTHAETHMCVPSRTAFLGVIATVPHELLEWRALLSPARPEISTRRVPQSATTSAVLMETCWRS
jgi:hypothetical protein